MKDPELRPPALNILLEHKKISFKTQQVQALEAQGHILKCLSAELPSCIHGYIHQPAACPGQIQHSAGYSTEC